MKKVIYITLALAAFGLGCGSDGDQGEPGAVSLVETVEEPAGENCTHGGVVIVSGIDADLDGELSDSEVSKATYVCNGAKGDDGDTGGPGDKGAPALVETEDATTCGDAGGVLIRVGNDLDLDGLLGTGEITSERTVCNADVTDLGPILIAETEVMPGAVCGGGGMAVQVGHDLDKNGTLSPEEVESELVECGPCLAGFGQDPADATQCVAIHTIYFEGVVDMVNDQDDLKPGVFAGERFQGTIELLATSPKTDVNPDSRVGVFEFRGVPNKFEVTVSNKTFSSSSAAEIDAEFRNDFGFTFQDEYFVRSMVNDDYLGTGIESMELSMFDADGMVFASDGYSAPIPMMQAEQAYLAITFGEGGVTDGPVGPEPGPVLGGGPVAIVFGTITKMDYL